MGQHNQVLSEREVDSQALGSFEAVRQQRIPYKDSRSCLLFINHTKRALDTWYCWRNRFSSVQDKIFISNFCRHFVRIWRFYPFRVNMHDWISQMRRPFYFGIISMTFKHTILTTVMCTDVSIILNGNSISEHIWAFPISEDLSM